MKRPSFIYKVAALRLFHPTVSSVLFGAGFYYCDTVSDGGGLRWGCRRMFRLTPALSRQGRGIKVLRMKSLPSLVKEINSRAYLDLD
jgi:hypothetical protein